MKTALEENSNSAVARGRKLTILNNIRSARREYKSTLNKRFIQILKKFKNNSKVLTKPAAIALKGRVSPNKKNLILLNIKQRINSKFRRIFKNKVILLNYKKKE